MHPERFVNLGIEPPKGVLLYGPPGTGKTLCARAVANRTDACFIRVIGSELVQKVIYILELAIGAHFIFLLFNSPSSVHLNYSDAEMYGNDRHFMRESKGTSSMHILA